MSIFVIFGNQFISLNMLYLLFKRHTFSSWFTMHALKIPHSMYMYTVYRVHVCKAIANKTQPERKRSPSEQLHILQIYMQRNAFSTLQRLRLEVTLKRYRPLYRWNNLTVIFQRDYRTLCSREGKSFSTKCLQFGVPTCAFLFLIKLRAFTTAKWIVSQAAVINFNYRPFSNISSFSAYVGVGLASAGRNFHKLYKKTRNHERENLCRTAKKKHRALLMRNASRLCTQVEKFIYSNYNTAFSKYAEWLDPSFVPFKFITSAVQFVASI